MALEFVKYTGAYPNLCSGELTVREGNKEWTIERWAFKSGGCVWFDDDCDEHVEEGPWLINEDYVPDELKSRIDELTFLMNEYVPEGCCGGCV